MARITVEDCLKNVENRFALVHVASKRVKELRSNPVSYKGPDRGNRIIVKALREIADGTVKAENNSKPNE